MIGEMLGEIRAELTDHIIPFWNGMADYENGGFCGYMSHNLVTDKSADKGVILLSRILWFYSNCFLVLNESALLESAKHCFNFMAKHCVDAEYGGVYWSVKANGEKSETMKHIYCHAFFIYAMSSYYDASGDESALDLAMEVFEIAESRFADEVSYRECFTRDWQTRDNAELSENGINADKTMNSVLHLIEAYTELYRVAKNTRVAERLRFLLSLTYDKIYDKDNARLLVFFDDGMNPLGDVHSYGHDIEAAWLMDRAVQIAKDELPNGLFNDILAMNRKLAEKVYEAAFDEGEKAMNYENDGGRINKTRVWWAEAEAVVGFVKARDPRYLERARQVWEYIRAYVIDTRDGGEWHSQVGEDGVPAELPVVDEWKCPYHNGRMCLEVGFKV